MNLLITQIDIGGWFRWEFFYGMIAALLIIAHSFKKHVELAFLLAWTYTLTRALYIFERPEATYYQLTNAFNATSGSVFAEVLVIPLLVLIMHEKIRDFIWKLYAGFAILDIASIWFLHHGLCIPSTSVSFDTALLALYIPFAPYPVALAALVTILFNHGSTALMVLFSMYSAYYLFSSKVPRKHKFVFYPALLVAMAAISIVFKSSLYVGLHERMVVWGKFYAVWKDGWDFFGLQFGGTEFAHFFGIGAGSFTWVSILKSQDLGNVFVQLHNDWLQILFELGIVGVLLTACVFVVSIRKSLKDPRTLAGIVGTATFMCSYHPLRFFPSALLIALIFRKAIVK